VEKSSTSNGRSRLIRGVDEGGGVLPVVVGGAAAGAAGRLRVGAWRRGGGGAGALGLGGYRSSTGDASRPTNFAVARGGVRAVRFDRADFASPRFLAAMDSPGRVLRSHKLSARGGGELSVGDARCAAT